jgi:tripartite-type tricarboxylate transporter receptor subunit TctC
MNASSKFLRLRLVTRTTVLLRIAFAASIPLTWTAFAQAQEYPARPLQFLIGTPVGGSADVLGRAFAAGLSKRLGVPVVPINRDGANGVIAASIVASAKPDGYTVGFHAVGAFVSQPFLQKHLPYTNADIQFLCQVFELPLALVVPADSPLRSVDDFLRAARNRPGQLNVGEAGIGSVPHVAVSQLETLTHVTLNQINYRGDGEIVTSLLGGQLDAGAVGLSSVAGKPLRVLAIFSRERASTNPATPTLSELGIPLVKVGMVGLYTREGIPGLARSKLVEACRQTTSSQEFQQASRRMNQTVHFLPPDEWAARVADDGQQNKAVIEALTKSIRHKEKP